MGWLRLCFAATATFAAAACPAGHGRVSPNKPCVACDPGMYSLADQAQCSTCPAGTHSAATGASVCHCREGFYFDEVAARHHSIPAALWPTLGCQDCLTVLPVEQARISVECPGGHGPRAKGTHQQNNSAAARRRRTTDGAAEASELLLPRGPIIAQPGWYLESKPCVVEDQTSQLKVNRTCLTRHRCADSACFGLTDLIRKEMTEMPEAKTGLNRTVWCMKLHEIALAEGALLDELRIPPASASASRGSSSAMLQQGSWEEEEFLGEGADFFYTNEGSCKEQYIRIISNLRKSKVTGVQNYCHIGHDPESRACAECTPGLRKGDDNLCHNCEDYSLWLLIRGDIYTLLLFQVPQCLFIKSGQPQSLKSAMFATFMFFVQTVTLLGKDSGYFLGPGFVEQEGKQYYIDAVDSVGRFFSSTLIASNKPVIEVSNADTTLDSNATLPRIGETAVKAEPLCPLSVDRHDKFFKNVVFRSCLLLVGCTVWNYVLYSTWIYLRLHYYFQALFRMLSGGRLFKSLEFQWNIEAKVLWRREKQLGPPKTTCERVKKLLYSLVCQKGSTPQKKVFQPYRDKVIYGPSAIMLNFHSCGVLFKTLANMQETKHQADRVRARAHFQLQDTNHDGYLDKAELAALLSQLGEEPTDGDVAKFLSKWAPGSETMSQEQFVIFYLDKKRTLREKLALNSHSSFRRICSPCRWCTDDLSEFRPMGSVRAECVVTSKVSDVDPEIVAQVRRRKWCTTTPLPEVWFVHDFPDLLAFQETMAAVCADGDAGRVRVNHVWPSAQRQVLVNFDILPLGYTNSSRTFTPPVKTKKRRKWRHTKSGGTAKEKVLGLAVDGVEAVERVAKAGIKEIETVAEELHLKRSKVEQDNVKNGLEVRHRLEAVFEDALVPLAAPLKLQLGEGSGKVAASELDLELLVDMKDANTQSRFWRAVMMLCATVLYYPVIQETLPIIHCTLYSTDVFYDSTGGPDRTGVWREAELLYASDIDEVVERYMSSDRSIKCDGSFSYWSRHFIASAFAFVTLGFCIICPYLAYRWIHKGKKAARLIGDESGQIKGQKGRVNTKKKYSFLRRIFLGVHHPPTRRENLLFEERILRDPFSGLYAMCEQRAYYWFTVDLARKGLVTAIYIFGKELFDWHFVMLVTFVIFALGQDIAQPYRGRSENLFSFMTLLFVVVLIHTSTTVTHGSLLPLMIAGSVVFCTLITFVIAMIYNRTAEKELVAENDRMKRKALDLWGRVGKHMLRLNPEDTSESALKSAFRVFDDADTEGLGRKMRKTMNFSRTRQTTSVSRTETEGKARGDGSITRWEIMALRDDGRRISGRRIAGLEPVGGPPSDVVPCFNATEAEVDEMILFCDSDGTGTVTFEEFVAVIFDAYDDRFETDMLCEWLYSEFKRTANPSAKLPMQVRGLCGQDLTNKTTQHFRGLQKRYLERPHSVASPLATELESFMGMLEAISMRETVDDGNPPGFTFDWDDECCVGLVCLAELAAARAELPADDSDDDADDDDSRSGGSSSASGSDEEELLAPSMPKISNAKSARHMASSRLTTDELQWLSVKELHERAAADGIDQQSIDDARDADQPKEALIALIIRRVGAMSARP